MGGSTSGDAADHDRLPGDVRFRDRARDRGGCCHLPSGHDAGPPFGHPASGGCALDGARAGFGPIDSAAAPTRLAGGAPERFRLAGRPVDREPLAPLLRAAGGGPAMRSDLRSPGRGSPRARQCRRLFRDRGTFRHTRPRRALSRAPFPARCPGWPAGAVAARLHRRSRTTGQTSLRLAFAGRIEATCAPATSAGRCPHEHDHGPPEHLDPRIRGRDDCARFGREVAFQSEAAAGAPRGQGSRHRCSTLAIAIARARDFAPTSIAPGTFRRETSRPAGLERRGGGGDAADARHTSKVRRAKGWRAAGSPRRDPASTSPRCLPSRGRSQANGRMPASRS